MLHLYAAAVAVSPGLVEVRPDDDKAAVLECYHSRCRLLMRRVGVDELFFTPFVHGHFRLRS